MAKQKRFIPNPNKMSNTEQSFISKETKDIALTEELNTKDKYKGRMISMSDSFYQQLNNYLKNHPTEGNRSSFIVRVVAEYIEKKI
jgi:hypothetical protein